MPINVSTTVELRNILLLDLQAELNRKTKQIFDGVVSRSPVREGSFRNSWKITKHKPSVAKFKRSGSVLKPTPAPTAKQVKFKNPKRTKVYISSIYGTSSMPKLPKIFITNNAPYAELLENGCPGGSKQAPNGIIAVTMASLNL